jgi:N-acetylneuraminic acid mutarotase
MIYLVISPSGERFHIIDLENNTWSHWSNHKSFCIQLTNKRSPLISSTSLDKLVKIKKENKQTLVPLPDFNYQFDTKEQFVDTYPELFI